jgi:hypothetical protein
MKHLIGLTGHKKAGKDTALLMLAEIVKPITLQRIGFADALKHEVANATGKPIWYINEHKNNFRLILQGWGTDFRRRLHGENYWIDRWQEVYDISEADIVVVPDVRFINEAHYLQKAGGVIWRIKRPLSEIDLHISETELDEYQFPTINNDSTFDNLKRQLHQQYALYTTQHPVP